ncbi:MAG: butyrate kinase [Lentimicrobiaceae bacterium]|jgi:butyrate kinase|nr:butyrate kinase [Lentimicrobiaceae bacterium]MDD4597741.1 butyrate kinase [Lentimicrobiaceae bacterium]MDY0025835.1 butyrate kinase [Lentimicrobium sp.]HAH59636.1 butyrate kinase [Bacteroidales bacterium]
MEDFRILAINPGSTSTKIAVFQGNNPVFVRTITHSAEELSEFDKVTDQYAFRKEIIYKQLEEAGVEMENIRAVVGRGGLTKPIPSGVYEVNEAMKHDMANSPMGEHASNLGGFIADDIAKSLPNARAFIADPVVVDELSELARVSGHPEFSRKSIFHALNQKAIARQHARSIMRKYEDLNLIVVHLGGGISVGAHQRGLVVDVNQALDGEGPFSPERSGTLPSADLVRLSYSGKFTQKELLQMIKGKGGMTAFLGTNNAYEVEKRAQAGDEHAKFIFEAMAYQVAKTIGAMSTVLKGEVDSILITGGIAHSKWFVNQVIERVYKIAPVHVYPGEDEMRALAMNGLMVLKGEVEVKEY